MWPSSLPAMSCIGETADRSTSITRLDFSSIVVVSRPWPLPMTPMNSRNMKATGSTNSSPPTVPCSALSDTVTERTRAKVVRSFTSARSRPRALSRAPMIASRTAC